jgi:signal peptidase
MPRTRTYQLRAAARTAGLAAGLLIALATLLPAALGYERYVITSGSMSGSYDRGSLVYSDEVPTADLRVGDVITYTPPHSAGEGDSLVTHRIVAIRTDTRGRVFRTKGDANEHADPWHFRLEQPTQARASFAVPYAGYVFAALSIKPVRMLVIGLPALLIALALLSGLWREAGEEIRHRKPAEGASS